MRAIEQKRMRREIRALAQQSETHIVTGTETSDGEILSDTSKTLTSRDLDCEETLQRVSERVTAATLQGIPRKRHSDFLWRFHLVRDEEPLAIALPDGMVLISTGTVAGASSDDELAAVLAHECAHVASRTLSFLQWE